MALATWRKLILKEMEKNGETMEDFVSISPKRINLDKEFDSGMKAYPEGEPFLLWSVLHVYYPTCYDGSEWVESVPRNPCDAVKDHSGGG